MSENEFPLPPANFEFLVWSLVLQAEMHMGLRRMPGDEEQAEKNIPAARHAIDMLGVVQEKTKGNLTLEEQRLIDNSLTELRFRFLEAAKTNG
jgi:hypothetical protein